MNTRKIVLAILAAALLIGIGSFVVRSVQVRGELGKVASKDATSQEAGVRNLMASGALFDALQGGAPKETRLNAIGALERLAAKDGKDGLAAFEQLLQMLKDPDTESAEAKTHPVRDAAKDAVARTGTRYPDRLVAACKDPDGAIKDQARAAIKQIGAPMQEKMAANLGDSALRAPFGDILSGLGPQTIGLVTPYLAADKLPPADKPDDLAKAKVELLEIMGKYKVPEAALACIPFRNDENPNVRRTVITSLANNPLPEGAAVLIAALNDPSTDSDARAAAAGALGAIASPEANAAMAKALSDYDLRVATAAAAGLKRAGDRAGSAIATALKNPDPAVRARAAEASGGMSTITLAASALKDPDASVRAVGASAIGDMLVRANQIRATVAGLSDADPKNQESALNALKASGILIETLTGPSRAAARAAAVAVLRRVDAAAKTPDPQLPALLAQIDAAGAQPDRPDVLADGGRAAMAVLASALADPAGSVAETSGLSLSRVGDAAVTPLIALLKANETVAYYASEALATIGKPAVPALTTAAAATPRWVAITLGNIGDASSVPTLEQIAQSPDPDTAYAATVALSKVKTG